MMLATPPTFTILMACGLQEPLPHGVDTLYPMALPFCRTLLIMLGCNFSVVDHQWWGWHLPFHVCITKAVILQIILVVKNLYIQPVILCAWNGMHSSGVMNLLDKKAIIYLHPTATSSHHCCNNLFGWLQCVHCIGGWFCWLFGSVTVISRVLFNYAHYTIYPWLIVNLLTFPLPPQAGLRPPRSMFS